MENEAELWKSLYEQAKGMVSELLTIGHSLKESNEVRKRVIEDYETALDESQELIRGLENDLEMVGAILSKKDEEIAMLRRDLARQPIGRDNW